MKTERGYSGVNPTTCVLLSSIAAGIHLSECCLTDALTVARVVSEGSPVITTCLLKSRHHRVY